MLIYRVEDELGRGPYKVSHGVEIFRHDITGKRFCGDYTRYHPDPVKSGIMPNPDLFYGFASFIDLYNWFGGYFESMQKNGFRIVVYEVFSADDVQLGDVQCAFYRECAVKCIEYTMMQALDHFTR